MRRKQRTRQHIIADLSSNFVERFALLCGYSVERFFSDYGLDLTILTYDDNGEVEPNHFYIQLKATEQIKSSPNASTLPLRVDRSDLALWLIEAMPVILVLFEAQTETAYWTYVQAYFQQRPDFDLTKIGQTYTMRLKKVDIVDTATMRQFACYKQRITQQMSSEEIHHEI
jgi:Domain of unknown function (DUF4365)